MLNIEINLMALSTKVVRQLALSRLGYHIALISLSYRKLKLSLQIVLIHCSMNLKCFLLVYVIVCLNLKVIGIDFYSHCCKAFKFAGCCVCCLFCLCVLYDMSTNLMLHQKLPSGLIINFELELNKEEK